MKLILNELVSRGRLLLLVGIISSVGVLFFWISLEPVEKSDFITLYAQAVALCQHFSIYDERIQSEIISQLIETPTVIPPAPYLPWYIIPIFFLGFFPIRMAARIWFWFNIAMLIAGMLLIMRGQAIRKQFFILLGCIFFPPVIMLLIVGQRTMPVLLGIGLCYYGIQRRNAFANACGSFLFTLKSHLGILLLPAVAIMSFQESKFFRRTLFYFAIILATMLGISFIIEPHWINEIIGAFSHWRMMPVNVQCDTCSSLTVELTKTFSFGRHDSWFGIGSFAVGISILVWIWLSNGKIVEVAPYMSLTVLLTLLSSLYVRNYDYVLFLVPFAAGMQSQSPTTRITFLIGYNWSFAVTSMATREWQGHLLWISAIIPLFPIVMELRHSRKELILTA